MSNTKFGAGNAVEHGLPLPTLHAEAAAHIRFVTTPGAPGTPDQVRVHRYFPAPHHSDEFFRDEEAALSRIRAAETHFQKLGDLGIRVPVVYENKIVPAERGVRVESIVEYVPHRPLLYPDEHGYLDLRPEDEDVALEVLHDSVDYLNWLKGRRGLMLADSSRIEQYAVAADRQPFFPDTDPYMQPTTSHMTSMAMAQVWNSLEVLPTYENRVMMLDRLHHGKPRPA